MGFKLGLVSAAVLAIGMPPVVAQPTPAMGEPGMPRPAFKKAPPRLSAGPFPVRVAPRAAIVPRPATSEYTPTRYSSAHGAGGIRCGARTDGATLVDGATRRQRVKRLADLHGFNRRSAPARPILGGRGLVESHVAACWAMNAESAPVGRRCRG
jgi:hypothetical protein